VRHRCYCGIPRKGNFLYRHPATPWSLGGYSASVIPGMAFLGCLCRAARDALRRKPFFRSGPQRPTLSTCAVREPASPLPASWVTQVLPAQRRLDRQCLPCSARAVGVLQSGFCVCSSWIRLPSNGLMVVSMACPGGMAVSRPKSFSVAFPKWGAAQGSFALVW